MRKTSSKNILFWRSVWLVYQRRQWHPTPVLLPGKFHGGRSLVGCSPWGTKGQTWLSNFTFTFHFHALEKEMATHSSVLAWRIPRMGEPGGLLSMGSHRIKHDWSDLVAAENSPSNYLILCHLLLLLPFIFPSIRVFSSKSALSPGGQNIGAQL